MSTAAIITRSASASPSAHSALVDPSLFPLKSIADVVKFFKRALECPTEPDLTLLSIVAGYVELSLTTGEAAQTAAAAAVEHGLAATSTSTALTGTILGSAQSADATGEIIMGNSLPFPVVTHELVAGLYKKFQTILAVVEKPKGHSRQATREIIKKVSDVIWHSLIRSSYKDRAHLQNLYSYLSGNKLDCFGVAFAVVAGCQLLGYRDVRLAIAEDHAWVVFGNSKRPETIEVTWHGKGSEDKRGQDITMGIDSGSWLYLGGLAVVCDRGMEVAAIASAINISLTGNSDCVEVAELQQQLLWQLYDLGYLKKYPMALGTLGELEEINPTHAQLTCEQLYREAIQSARTHYRNHHVYPYTYQGNYYNRLLKYREAFAAWANAADVIRLYTYSCRDDEEIYKELLDIANEMIPFVMKTESSGHSARSILRDSEVFANLLRFYDGICQWEEDSLTPILHIGWAKPLVNNITKFDYDIRSQVLIKVPDDENIMVTQTASRATEAAVVVKQRNNEAKGEHTTEGNNNINNNNLVKKEEKIPNDAKKGEMPTTLADLTAACGEKILNPDFLLQGGGQPFADQKQQQEHNQIETNNQSINNNNNNDNNEANGTKKTTESKIEVAIPTDNDKTKQTILMKEETDKTEATAANLPAIALGDTSSLDKVEEVEEDPFEFMYKRPIITLYSQKMKGLKDLLLTEKLNTHAISLQVTAQSVASRKVRGIDKLGNHTTNSTYASAHAAGAGIHHHVMDSSGTEFIAASRPKRSRRE